MVWEIRDTTLTNWPRGYKVQVASVEFPHLVYPIRAGVNNAYTFSDGTLEYSGTVPEGSYTGSSMATALESSMNTVSGGSVYTVTYDLASKKLTLAYSSGTLRFIACAADLYDELGFHSQMLAVNAGASVVADYPVQLSGTRYVDVFTNLRTMHFSSGDTARPLCRIPMPAGFGYDVIHQPIVPVMAIIKDQVLNRIELLLRDDKGRSFILPPTSNFSLSMHIGSL